MNIPDEDQDTGLVCAYLFDGKGGARQLQWSELEAVRQVDGTLWVHLDFSKLRARQWLVESSRIDESIVDAMLQSDTRPRSFQFKNGILAMLRGVNNNPNSDVEDMVTLRIWMQQDLIISVRRRQLLSIKDIRESFEKGQGPADVGEFLSHISDHIIDRISEVINQIADNLDARELELQQDEMSSQRVQFSAIRLRSAHIRRYLAPQRDAFERLSRMAGNILSESDCMDMSENANQMTFFVEELDLARERAMLAQEEIFNLLAQKQNSKMFLLAIVAAVFLPLSFLTGLMGMNVAGLPGLENPQAFNIVVGIMTTIGIGILLILWKKNWF